MAYLLSGLGTLVCQRRDDGALVQRSLADSLDGVDLLDVGGPAESIQVGLGHFLRNDAALQRWPLSDGPLAGWTIARSDDCRSVILVQETARLSASTDSDAVSPIAGSNGLEARFMPLSATDLSILRELPRWDWLSETTDPAQGPRRASVEPGFTIRVGPLVFDLRWNLPFDASRWPHRLTLSRDAWKIERLFRYRPIVYFAAYNEPAVLRQFALAVTSLVTVGLYDGDIVVLTDKTPAEIGALFPDGPPARLVVLPIPGVDRAAYSGARYAIATWPGAWEFQPLLYVDCDVLFDWPVDPMLREIARADRICGPGETSPLSDSLSLGSLLFAEDGRRPAPGELGFNAGTLGIPNLPAQTSTLALMARTLGNRIAVAGRHTQTFIDQPVANYVAHRTGAVDTGLLTPYVRLVGADADPADRTGIAHFCLMSGHHNRVATMERYLERLRAIS